jgi:dTDP-4-dehydrorhamnose 3,5-epimerase-like enzyme
MEKENLWQGLRPEARAQLILRDYSAPSIEQRLSTEGLEAGTAMAGERALKEIGAWIPGVEVIQRQVHPQRHRGIFSELGRQGEGRLGEIRLWPTQWAAAKMFAGSAKGFHVHPPYIPENETPASWFAKLFGQEGSDYSLRRYDLEQWDVMYFLQGRLDLTLCDERESFPRRRMRLFIDGDERRGGNNVAIVIPPGVAHALRAEGSEDLLMVYGTSTVFHPPNEGRIASQVEELSYPEEWEAYLDSDSK